MGINKTQLNTFIIALPIFFILMFMRQNYNLFYSPENKRYGTVVTQKKGRTRARPIVYIVISDLKIHQD